MSIPLGSTISTDDGQVIVAVPGIQGPPGSTWRVGVGAPDNSVGIDGDFYINTVTGFFYQRQVSAYVSQGSLIGPAGPGVRIRGTMPAGAWSAPVSPQPGDMWVAEGVITGAVTAVEGDGINWNGAAWVNSGPFRGPVGPPGATGAAGPAGATGPAGPAGATGAAGPPGATGPAGPAGATGPAGTNGTNGTDGTGVAIQGPIPGGVWSAPPSPSAGDLWIAEGTITGAVTAVEGEGILWNGTSWVNVGPIRGPVGPAGPAGATGAAGPAGATGPAGPAGATGPAGPSGSDTSKTPRFVATIAALRALTATQLTDYGTIIVGGYYADGDEGGGRFWVDNSDTTTADDGGSCLVIDGKRVKADFGPGDVPIRRWGCKSESTAMPSLVNGCHTKLQAAIDWAYSIGGRVLSLGSGDYWIGAKIWMKGRVRLKGNGVNFADGVPTAVDSDTMVPALGTTRNTYRKAGTSCITLISGANCQMIGFDPTGMPLKANNPDPVPDNYQVACGLEGIVLHGNGDGQTRYDCHLLDVRHAWSIDVVNCGFFRAKGYLIYGDDNNGVHFFRNVGCSQNFWGKGIFFDNCADYMFKQNKFGAGGAPILWISGGLSSWVCHIHDNMLYNSMAWRWPAVSVASNIITLDVSQTTQANHMYETGMPCEVFSEVVGGGTIPSPLAQAKRYFVIKVSATQIKLATSYENALAGTAINITGGSGTWYVMHGTASGIYASDSAYGITFIANRTEESGGSGITLAGTKNISIIGSIAVKNGHANLTPFGASGETAAGVRLRAGADGTIIQGSVFYNYTSSYPQPYGVWLEATAGKCTVGINTYGTVAGAITPVRNDAAPANLIQPVMSDGGIDTPNLTTAQKTALGAVRGGKQVFDADLQKLQTYVPASGWVSLH